MTPIQKALQDIRFSIPREILQEAFIRHEFGDRRAIPVTVDARIRELVIEARVLVDCNLVGGTEIVVDLSRCPAEQIDSHAIVYRIPMAMTDGRRITRVIALEATGHVDGYATNYGNVGGNSPIWNSARQMTHALMPLPQASTARLNLIADNTLLVRDAASYRMMKRLRCIVEHDPDMSLLKPTSYPAFSQLCILATKAYIYNTLAIPMGEAYLQGGFDLGRFREIVDGYSDANEQYQEYLKDTYRVIAVMSDYNQNKRHLRILVGGPR